VTVASVSLRRPRAAAAPARRAGAARCVVAVALFWLSLYLYVPVLPVQAHALGADVAGVGVVLAAYGFVQFVLRVPTGVWSDRLGRRQPFLVASLSAAAVAAAGMGAAATPPELGLFRAVSGLAACGWVAMTVLMAELLPAAGLGGALALAGFVSRTAQLAGTFAGGAIAQVGGLRAPFWVAAAVAAAGGLIALGVAEPDRPAPPRVPSLGQRLAVGFNRRLLAASGLALAAQCVSFVTTYGFLPLVAATRFRAGGLDLGLLSVAGGLPAALAALWAGPLGRRCRAFHLAAAGFVAAGIGTAAVPRVGSELGLDAVAVAIGAGLGLNAPVLMTAAVREFDEARRGTAMGIYQSIYAIGMFGGPALAGAVGTRWGMPALFEGTAAVGLLAAVLCRGLEGGSAAPRPPTPT
jgi:MFS family permease